MRTIWNNIKLPYMVVSEILEVMKQPIDFIELSAGKSRTTERSGVVLLGDDKLNFKIFYPLNNISQSNTPKDERLSVYIIIFPVGEYYIYTAQPEAAGSFSFCLPFSFVEKRARKKIPTSKKIQEKSSKKKSKPKSYPAEPLIDDVWNTLDRVSKHRRKDTATYQSARRILLDLLAGKGYQYTLDEKFLRSNRIPKKYLRKKWKRSALEKGMRNCALMLKPGYWPKNKSWVPLSLEKMLYNPVSGTSWILKALVNGEPDKLYEVVTKEQNKYPEITEMLLHKFFNNNISGRDYFQLCTAVAKAVKVHEGLNKSRKAKVRVLVQKYLPSKKQFIRDFALFASDKFDLIVPLFNPNSYAFKTYLTHLQRDLGVDFETGRTIA